MTPKKIANTAEDIADLLAQVGLDLATATNQSAVNVEFLPNHEKASTPVWQGYVKPET